MLEPSARQCGSCCFGRPMAGRLCCVRNPPTTDPATGRARWPQVHPTDICGAYCSVAPAPAAPIINNQSSIINAIVHTDRFGDYCKIPLTQGRFAKVDPEDYPWLAQFRWCVKVNVDNCYAVRTVQTKGKSKRIHMHRQIMNTPSGRVCDHINHDGLDNRRRNLRNCTVAQNNAHRRKRATPPNSRAPSHGSQATGPGSRAQGPGSQATSHGSRATSSQYIGVSRDKRSGKWLAYIRHRRRQRTLGLFDTELEAARTRDRAALVLHGEFATLNFPAD